MNALFDPNIAYLLLIGGFLMAVFAMLAPGTGFIEVIALGLLLIAGYAMTLLTVTWWALLLIILSAVFLVVALRNSMHWYWVSLAALLMLAGSLFLFVNANGAPLVNPILAALVSILTTGIIWAFGKRGLAATRRPVRSLDELVGMLGDATTDIQAEGSVYVNGEEWSAHAKVFIPRGSRVRILRRDGLVLEIEPETPYQ
jgi:membrane-bound serine protease (ClpP class)